jgi:hypothetical protein
MDYYRIKSLDWILKNRKHDEQMKAQISKILKKKCEVLIKGYIKHNNLENLGCVQDIYNSLLVG